MRYHFSPEHLAAFRKYEKNGYTLVGLDARTIDALCEDENFRFELKELERKWKADAEKALPQQAAAAVRATAPVHRSAAVDPVEETENFGKLYGKFINDSDHEADLLQYIFRGCNNQVKLAVMLLGICAFAKAQNDQNKKRNARIDALEKRIAELEAKPGSGIDAKAVAAAIERRQRGERD